MTLPFNSFVATARLRIVASGNRMSAALASASAISTILDSCVSPASAGFAPLSSRSRKNCGEMMLASGNLRIGSQLFLTGSHSITLRSIAAPSLPAVMISRHEISQTNPGSSIR